MNYPLPFKLLSVGTGAGTSLWGGQEQAAQLGFLFMWRHKAGRVCWTIPLLSTLMRKELMRQANKPWNMHSAPYGSQAGSHFLPFTGRLFCAKSPHNSRAGKKSVMFLHSIYADLLACLIMARKKRQWEEPCWICSKVHLSSASCFKQWTIRGFWDTQKQDMKAGILVRTSCFSGSQLFVYF